MSHKTMANLLWAVIIILVLCGLFMQIWWIPLGTSMFFLVSKPFIILANVALIPCYAVTVIAWLISDSIAKEQEFCHRNAKLFRCIFGLALGDSAFFVLGSVVLFILKQVNIWCVFITLPLAILGICVAICAAVMSHLIDRAAGLQEDADLTI